METSSAARINERGTNQQIIKTENRKLSLIILPLMRQYLAPFCFSVWVQLLLAHIRGNLQRAILISLIKGSFAGVMSTHYRYCRRHSSWLIDLLNNLFSFLDQTVPTELSEMAKSRQMRH